MHCIHIDRIFLHKLFYTKANRFSLSLPLSRFIFFIPFFLILLLLLLLILLMRDTRELFEFFPLIFFFSFSLPKSEQFDVSVSVSLVHIHMFIPPTVGYTQNRMMRKAQVKRCTIVFILFICCRRFCVCVSVFFLLVFDYFYLT